ncbi:MAG: hypothetical protein QNJ46_12820 [Leptolyngbyaceae cyanobacterium MO_188.B28]|nr:hypothetical protein [Leptolyngbyaceae cyanobacterium MO_188.B28]
MIIDTNNNSQEKADVRSQLGHWLSQHRWLAVLGMAPVFVGAALVLETLATVPGLPETASSSLGSGAKTRYFKALWAQSNRPTLQIDMKFKHYNTLTAKRREALQKGELHASGKVDLVPAKIQINGNTVPVRMRLKNGGIDHLKTDQWSYQVWVKDIERIFGIKHFTLQYPRAQTTLHRWIWLQHLRYESVPALRSQFANVVFNGTSKGVFVMEEDVAREFTASQRKLESVIVKFASHRDPSSLESTDLTVAEPSKADDYRKAGISAGQANRLDQLFILSQQREAAISLLTAFQTEDLPASQVFDVPLLAKFLALCDLWQIDHGLKWTDIHFYYNPITAKLEPIGFLGDLNSTASESDPASLVSPLSAAELHSEPWVRQALADPVIAAAYTQELHRITRPNYLKAVQSELQGAFENLPLSLFRDPNLALNPGSHAKSVWRIPQQRQTEIRRSLAAGKGLLKTASPSVDLDETDLGETGTDALVSYPTSTFSMEQALRAPTIEQALARHPFLRRGEREDVLLLQSGEWDVQGHLILPQGIRLQAEPGVTLRFEADALLVARGPLEFLGEATAPILLTPQEDVWGGILMLASGAASTWSHVVVNQTQGGVTLYRSPISMIHCQLLGSQAEDVIKVIESSFEIRHSQFSGVMAGSLERKADALDGESVEGVIESSQFVNVSGDAIDLSDSYVHIRDVSLQNIGDKGLSIGQGSEVEATDIQAVNLDIAAASLDQSQLRLDRISIENASEAGLSAYQQRVSWGPANIVATQVKFRDTPHETQVRRGSWISLEGSRIE